MVHAFDQWTHELQVVLRGNDSVLGANNKPRYYHGGWCVINFPANGDLYADIFGSEGIYNVDFEPNPSSPCPQPVRCKLQGDGNFVIRCSDNNTTDYFTHSNQGGAGNYFMAIDNVCELHIFKGTFQCDAIDIQQEVWSSHKRGSWGINERLYRGQVYELMPKYDVVLNPRDGNLEVWQSVSAKTREIVWSADDTWKAPPEKNSNDFYAKLTPGGASHLGRDRLSFNERNGILLKDLEIWWSRLLHPWL